MQRLTSFVRAALGAAAFVFSCAANAQPTGTLTWFHNDVAGTPQMATNAAGAVVWRESYRPYGDRVGNQPAATANNKLWFAGKPQDANTGLSYMGARYYDPLLGRFMGVDPVDFDEENIHSFNRYAYANNNPYRFVDPDGHSALDVIFLAYDLAKLGVAMHTGVGVGAAAADVAMSAIGVVSPVPGTGQALKAARAVDRGVDGAKGAARSVDELSRAAAAADRGGLTAAGRALQKHGGREGSSFPAAKGSPLSVNQQSQHVVDDILTSPGNTTVTRNHARFGQVTEVRAPDGRGVRYGPDGKFIGLLEPNK